MSVPENVLKIPYIVNSVNFTARMLDGGEKERAEREINYVQMHDGVDRSDYLKLVESRRKKTKPATTGGWV